MSRRRHSLLIWLCILAVWLGACMPAASALQRTISGSKSPAWQEICSVGSRDLNGTSGADSSKHGNSLDLCGYCSLAAHTPLLSPSVTALPAMLRVTVPAPVLPQYVYFPPRPLHGRTHPLDPPRPV